MDELILSNLAKLDDDALAAIIDSSSSQSVYLSRFKGDSQARALSAITGILSVAAEQALLRRRGVTI